MKSPTVETGVIAIPLALRVGPVWLRGMEREADTALRELAPEDSSRIRPLTLWSLLDQPISGVELRLSGKQVDRHPWLGLWTTVAREADAHRARQAIEAGLEGVHEPYPLLFRPTLAPPELPGHTQLLRGPDAMQKDPRSDLTELLHPVVCDLVDSLSARGNPTVLRVQVDLTRRPAQLGEVLEAWYTACDAMERVLQSPTSTEARFREATERQERVHALIRQFTGFSTTVHLHSRDPIPPRELQWALQQMEGTVSPQGRWCGEPSPEQTCCIDAFALDSLFGMLRPTEGGSDTPF